MSRLPQAPPAARPVGIGAESLARRIDQFLASRGYTPPAQPAPRGVTAPVEVKPPPAPAAAPPAVSTEKPVDFVCEDDVRQAVREGRKIVIGERTIVTPAARDLGDHHRVLVQAGLKG
jgi:hypothetical protein